MWKFLKRFLDDVARKEPPRNRAGEIIVDPRDRTYGIFCVCCETYFKVSGKKVQKCVNLPGFKAECPTCSEVNFFDSREAI